MRPVPLLKAMVGRKTPVYVHYGVTHRCNLTCRMCGLWKTGDRKKEMTLDRIERMAENFRRLGVNFISLGGGEPFMRDDLPQIISIMMKKGLMVRLLSNGIITDRDRLNEVLSLGITHISISLDTTDREKQGYICNRDDAWERATETLETFRDHFARNGGIGIINTVVSKLNIEEVPSLVDLAEKYGFHCSFVPIEIHHFGGKSLSCAEAQHDLNFTEGDHQLIRSTYDNLIDMKKKGRSIFNSTPFLRKSKEYLTGVRPSWQCRAGMLYFSVDPEGNFSICHRFKGYRKEPEEIPADSDRLLELFSSGDYFNECEKMIKACPGCLRPCWSEVSLVFTEAESFVEALKMQGRGKRKRKAQAG